MKIQVNLFLETEVVDMLDQLCAARGGKRSAVLAMMITRSHKKMERQIAAIQDIPAQAEQAEDRARWIVDRFISTNSSNEQPGTGEV